MSHQPINSFGFFMHSAPLLCATASSKEMKDN